MAMNRSVKFGIIGVGQGGGRLAVEFKKLGYPTVVVNTSQQDTESQDVDRKVIIGDGGAGRDTTVGTSCVERNKDKIVSAIQSVFTDVQHVLVCAGSSGGTGGGGIIPIVELITRLQLPVGVMTTFPLKSEDTRSKRNTLGVIKKLAEKVNNREIAPLILVDNERIVSKYPDLSTAEFWSRANAEVVKVFDLFNVLSARNTAYTSLDPADYKKILGARGCMVFGSSSIEGAITENSIADVLSSNLEKSLIVSGFDLLSATHAGLIIVGSEASLRTMPRKAEEAAATAMNRLLGSGTIYKGVYAAVRDIPYVEVLSMISGLQLPEARIRDLVEESKKQAAHLEKKDTVLTNLDDIIGDVK